MKFLDKMERKFGRYAIKGLTSYIIAAYVIGSAIMSTFLGDCSLQCLQRLSVMRFRFLCRDWQFTVLAGRLVHTIFVCLCISHLQ